MGHFSQYWRENTWFILPGWLFWGSRGVQEVVWLLEAHGGEQWSHCAAEGPGSVRKVQRGVFSTFLFCCSGIITRRNKEPFKAPSTAPGCGHTHTCQCSAGCEGTVTMHAHKNSPAGMVILGRAWEQTLGHPQLPREPQLQWGGSSGRATLLVSTPRQRAKSKSHPASWHPPCSCYPFMRCLSFCLWPNLLQRSGAAVGQLGLHP